MTVPKCYSATFTDDAHVGIEEVQRRFPDVPLFAAGYSLGALILTKYLAEADTGNGPAKVGNMHHAQPHGSSLQCAASWHFPALEKADLLSRSEDVMFHDS